MSTNPTFDHWFTGWYAKDVSPEFFWFKSVLLSAFEAGYALGHHDGEYHQPSCWFAIPTHHCALAEGHETPHQMVQTVQTQPRGAQG